MVFIRVASEFEEAVSKLVKERAGHVRMVVTTRPAKGQVLIKVTDDSTCLQFQLQSRRDIKTLNVVSDLVSTAMADSSIDADSGRPSTKPARSDETEKFMAKPRLSGAQRRKRRKARLEAAGVDTSKPGVLGSKGGRQGASKKRVGKAGDGPASGAGAAAAGGGK